MHNGSGETALFSYTDSVALYTNNGIAGSEQFEWMMWPKPIDLESVVYEIHDACLRGSFSAHVIRYSAVFTNPIISIRVEAMSLCYFVVMDIGQAIEFLTVGQSMPSHVQRNEVHFGRINEFTPHQTFEMAMPWPHIDQKLVSGKFRRVSNLKCDRNAEDQTHANEIVYYWCADKQLIYRASSNHCVLRILRKWRLETRYRWEANRLKIRKCRKLLFIQREILLFIHRVHGKWDDTYYVGYPKPERLKIIKIKKELNKTFEVNRKWK